MTTIPSVVKAGEILSDDDIRPFVRRVAAGWQRGADPDCLHPQSRHKPIHGGRYSMCTRCRAVRDVHAVKVVLGSMLRLIQAMAVKYSRRMSLGGPGQEDLLQIGLITVMRAVYLFNHNAGIKFVSYAGSSAAKEMCRAVKAWKVYRLLAESNDGSGLLKNEPAAPDHADEWAREQDTDERVRRLLVLVRRGLKPADRVLVSKKYGLDGHRPHSYNELAQLEGCSRQHVQQHIKRVLDRVRIVLSEMPGEGEGEN